MQTVLEANDWQGDVAAREDKILALTFGAAGHEDPGEKHPHL